MNLDNLTLGDLKEIKSLLGGDCGTSSQVKNENPFEVGKAYLFRTVTHIEVGRVKAVIGQFLEIEDASWIADTGRYHNCLRDGVFEEVEPYPEYSGVNTQALINYAPWNHDLPKEQKP